MAAPKIGYNSNINHQGRFSLAIGLWVALLFATQCAGYRPTGEQLTEARLQWRPQPTTHHLSAELLSRDNPLEAFLNQPEPPSSNQLNEDDHQPDYYLVSGDSLAPLAADSIGSRPLSQPTEEIYESRREDASLDGNEVDLIAEVLRAYQNNLDNRVVAGKSSGQDYEFSNSNSNSVPRLSLYTQLAQDSSSEPSLMRDELLTYSLPLSDAANLSEDKSDNLVPELEFQVENLKPFTDDGIDEFEGQSRQLRDKSKPKTLTTLLDKDEEAAALKYNQELDHEVTESSSEPPVKSQNKKKVNSDQRHGNSSSTTDKQIAGWSLGDSLRGLYSRISSFLGSYLYTRGKGSHGANTTAEELEQATSRVLFDGKNDKLDRQQQEQSTRRGNNKVRIISTTTTTTTTTTGSPKTDSELPRLDQLANELESNESAHVESLTDGVIEEANQVSRPTKKLVTPASHDNKRISLMRQSGVVMPLSSNDELLEAEQPSKYLYEPEQRFRPSHLAYGPLSPQRGFQDQPNLGPYSSYRGGFQPIHYDPQRDHNHPSVSQSNDLYFLVMVAAFCAMTMAVVLSAGLFAYRVQQSRKSTLDTDYPTYGVVGPNNMSAKCNAASFVGGYFGSNGGVNCPGSSSSCTSKTSTIKQLSDYHVDPNSVFKRGKRSSNDTANSTGVSQSPSQNAGLSPAVRKNSLISNQNAARMYHYQHQKQQMIISDRVSAGRHTSASDLDSEDDIDDGTYTVYECPGLASAHEMEIKNPLFRDDHSP